MNNSQWAEMYEETLDERIKKLTEYTDAESVIDQLEKIKKELQNKYIDNVSSKGVKSAIKKMVKLSNDFDSLENSVEKSRELGYRSQR